MAKKKTDLQKAAEEQATVALSKISVIKNKKRGDEKKEIKVVKPTTPEAPKRRGRPTISGSEEKQEKRCTLYMTTEIYQKIERVARLKQLSVNQFFLSLAKDEIEKPEYVKMLEILDGVTK